MLNERKTDSEKILTHLQVSFEFLMLQNHVFQRKGIPGNGWRYALIQNALEFVQLGLQIVGVLSELSQRHLSKPNEY